MPFSAEASSGASGPLLTAVELFKLRAREESESAFAARALRVAAQIESGEVSEDEWKEALWQRDVVPHAQACGISIDILRTKYDNLAAPMTYAQVALDVRFASYLTKNYEMTEGFRHFLSSGAFLEKSSLIRSFVGFVGSSAGGLMRVPWRFPVLALAREVLRKGEAGGGAVTNVLFAGDLGDGRDMYYLRPMLFIQGSEDPRANFVYVRTPSSNVYATRIDGKPAVSSSAGLLLRDGKWHLAAFDDDDKVSYHYAFNGFVNSLEHRTASAQKRDPFLPELQMQAIPHPASSEYVAFKDIALGLAAANGVRIPATLAFWTSKEEISITARRMREAWTSRTAATADGPEGAASYASIRMEAMPHVARVAAIRRFMQEHNVSKFVLKPVDSMQGLDVWLDRGESWNYTPEIIANRVQHFEQQGRSVVLQKMIDGLALIQDGQRKDWNLRVWVSPDATGLPTACGCVVRIGPAGEAVNLSRGATAATIDELKTQLAKQYPGKANGLDGLEREIAKMSEEACRVAAEATVRDGLANPGDDMLSFYGVDICVDGLLRPHIIELNGANSGGMGSLAEHLLKYGKDHPLYVKHNSGFPFELYIDSIVRRAREYQRGQKSSRG